MKTSDQDECVLCCREIYIFAIGACDHPVCYQCSARMRVLCETNECPICRSDMPVVIWTGEEEFFSDISRRYSLFDRKFQITFENAEIQQAFNSLLENNCNICEEGFQSFNKLKDHVRRRHDLHYCELCTENLRIFPFERKVYNRKDLARHKRVGDPDDTSHRGHPLCEFCDQRYVDSDELFRHLRREHYFCHFCDADGKHQYYEDYDYLRVHFRKEHHLCEEGDCANEQFTGAFRSEIDLKAHIAVHHSRNKSKAEVRQTRMLEFEFAYTYPNRPSGSSSPRGGRYHQQKRQNIEENTREKNSSRESNQQAGVEKINTTSTLEFPYLSEDGDNRSNNVAPVPTSNFNSVTVQSIGRSSAPLRHKKGISAEDFPALVSTTSVNVTSEVTNNQARKFNISVNRQNNAPARSTSSLSLKLSQASAQPKQPMQNADKKQPNWICKKKTNFEDDFPKLETKKTPVAYTNVVNTAVVNNVQSIAPSTVVPVSSHVSNGDQFVTIKAKSKKKKHNRVTGSDDKAFDGKEDTSETDEFANKPNFMSSNSYELLDQENKDPFKRNLVRSGNSSRNNYIEEDTWHQKVCFANDDFPPLAPSEVIRKPPGLSAPKKKTPPPGFNLSSNASKNSQSLNITLSTVARQLVISNKDVVQIPHSDQPYKSPPDFQTRNDNLVKKIKDLSVFDEFKIASGEFRKNDIPASDYYSKCLEILGEKVFYEIFAELIALLPDINKQQELFDVHRRYQNRHNGAVPKQKLLNNNGVAVCDICYQVLLEKDVSSHLHD